MSLGKDASFWLPELPEAGTEWAFVSSTVSPLHELKVGAMETGGSELKEMEGRRDFCCLACTLQVSAHVA